MRSVIAIIVIILLNAKAFSQVCGISAGKLAVPHAYVLEKGSFEFEPSFAVLHSTSFFNQSGVPIKLNGEQIESALLFRVTFGLSDKLELGSSISSTVDNIALGAKYFAFDFGKVKSSLLAGICLPAGNNFTADSIKSSNIYSACLGSVTSLEFNETTSSDFLIAYSKPFSENQLDDVLILQFGAGHYINDELQIVLELSGVTSISNNFKTGKISFIPGITYTVTSTLGIAVGIQQDLMGKNEYRSLGYFAAFTILFN